MKVRLAVNTPPTPRPSDMASLARVAVEQRDYRDILTRWERRLANRVMDKIAKGLGIDRGNLACRTPRAGGVPSNSQPTEISSTCTRRLPPLSGGSGLLSDRRTLEGK